MNRAYVLLDIKEIDEKTRRFKGIASTAATDRMDDIVEPGGAVFALPLSFLHQHDTKKPVGQIDRAKVVGKEIHIEGFVERMDEPDAPASLKDRVDTAWFELKKKLVRGLSIGFKELDSERIKETGGTRFKRWSWLELSMVTIPANSEATITSIKSAYGAAPGRSVVRLGASNVAGASADPNESKGIGNVKTIQEKLAGWNAKRAETEAARSAIMTKAESEGDRTLTPEEGSEYDSMGVEVKDIDSHIARLKEEEIRVKATAVIVSNDPTDPEPSRGTPSGRVFMKDTTEPGIEFARYVKCHMLSGGNEDKALKLAKMMYPESKRIHNVMTSEANHGATITKANVLAATTTDATWAGALVQYQDLLSTFLDWLRPQTIVGQFGQNGVPGMTQVPFNARVRAQTSGGTAYWTGEGKPKPLTKFDFTNITMATTKIAAIAVVTQETLRLATPSADALVRNALRGAIIERMDRDFIDPDFAGSAGVSPASITYGAGTATASGTINSAAITDMNTAMGTMLASFPDATVSGLVLIMPARTAFALSQGQNALGQPAFPGITIRGGQLGGIPLITSEYAWYGGGGSPGSNGLVILVHAPSIFLADDGAVTIDSSDEASLQMLDNPTNDTVTPTATTLVSMYQTNSVAIRAERFVNWKRARDGAVFYLTNAAYSGLAA